MSSVVARGGCVAVVDPLSVGGSIVQSAALRGFAVIAVWTAELTDELRSHAPPELRDFRFFAEVEEEPTLEATAATLGAAVAELTLAAIIVGSETGVTLADSLSEVLGLRTNGALDGGRSRRNKKVQQDLVREAGLRAVRGAWGTEWCHVEAFVDAEALPVVLKPVESAGTEGVKLCYTKAEAEGHFHSLMTTQRRTGDRRYGVLVQEFLRGKEYVIDHVSRDGVHKTVNCMVYDKRACNGADFVYFGVQPLQDCDSELARTLIRYMRGVLDAMGVKNGPTHGEAILTPDGPCLVEMNCRAAGVDGALVQFQRVTNGYSQVDATLDAYLDEDAFVRLPAVVPTPPRLHGQILMLVSTQVGRIAASPGIDRIRGMPSFLGMRMQPSRGELIGPTFDLATSAGVVALVHNDPDVLAADVAAIRRMEIEGSLFVLERPERSGDGDVCAAIDSASTSAGSAGVLEETMVLEPCHGAGDVGNFPRRACAQ